MTELSFEAVIARSRAEVWDQLRDLRVARHYVPGVTAIELNSAQREGIGASRKVFTKKRAPVDETAIAWEEGCGYTLKIHNGDTPAAPFKWATFQYAIEDAPGGQTLMRGTFSYEMAGGLFGRILNALIVRRAIERTNIALKANTKKFYETGEVTNHTAA